MVTNLIIHSVYLYGLNQSEGSKLSRTETDFVHGWSKFPHLLDNMAHSHWTQVPNNPGDRKQRWTVSFQEKICKYIQKRDVKLKKPQQSKPVLNVGEATRILSSYKHSSKITGGIFFLGYNILLPSVAITPTCKFTFFLHLFAPLWWIIPVKIPTPNLHSANFYLGKLSLASITQKCHISPYVCSIVSLYSTYGDPRNVVYLHWSKKSGFCLNFFTV